MSSISNVGSSSSINANPLAITQSVSGVDPASTSSPGLPRETYADILGVPLVGGSLGLPTGGAPGDSEALLSLVVLKLRQTVGQTQNNTDQSNANRYAQALAQAQQLVTDIVNAAQDLTTSQIRYQQDAIALSNDSDKLNLLYAPLTGSGSQQDLTKVTADSTGGQGDYGKYLAALNAYSAANSTSKNSAGNVSNDQKTLDAANAAASKTDPQQYYTATYLSLYNQQQSLSGMNNLSASDQQKLAILNGNQNVVGSVANSLAVYTGLQTAATNAASQLMMDQKAASDAASSLVGAEKALIPYLDQQSGSTFVDNHPQSGSPVTYTFDANALAGASYSTTGLISSEINPIEAVMNDQKTLVADQANLSNTIANAQSTLDNAQDVLLQLSTLSDSLASTLSQNSTDQSTNANARLSSDVSLDRSFTLNQDNVKGLVASQASLLIAAEITQRAAATVVSAPVQTALALATDITDTLAALADLTTQLPPPTSSDAYSPTTFNPDSQRLRIPV